MKILNVVKTNQGAKWAFDQAEELHKKGVEIICVMPNAKTGFAKEYKRCGIEVIERDFSLPVMKPWQIFRRCKEIRKIVDIVRPDLIHCHFVTNILMMRIALRKSSIPRLFQVPGPLHLESGLYKNVELKLATKCDFWAGACKKTCEIYEKSGISPSKVKLAYYGGYGGDTCDTYSEESGILHKKYQLDMQDFLIGMVSYFYKPKRYLGQRRGIKGHEDFIDAMAIVREKYPQAKALIFGGPWGNSKAYEEKIHQYAQRVCPGGIIFTGFYSEMKKVYKELNLAVHPSHSENLGGAAESLTAGIPTISTNIGGFPDIVVNGETGYTVPKQQPKALASAIIKVIEKPEKAKEMAKNGQKIARELLDIKNTATRVFQIYQYILDSEDKTDE